MKLIDLLGRMEADELMEHAKEVLSLLEQKDKHPPFKVGEYRLYLDKESKRITKAINRRNAKNILDAELDNVVSLDEIIKRYLADEVREKVSCKDCGHSSRMTLQGKGVEGRKFWYCDLYNIKKNAEGYCESFKNRYDRYKRNDFQ
jgi:hypothetical protein